MKRQPACKPQTRSLGMTALALLLGSATPVLAAAMPPSADPPCDQQSAPRPANPCAPTKKRNCPSGQSKAPGNPCEPRKTDKSTDDSAPTKSAGSANTCVPAAPKKSGKAHDQ
jgi:hypothetical protein